MLLYEIERHERVSDMCWDEGRARFAIERIVADTQRGFDEEKLWPIHPFDRSPERPPDSLKPVYYGAAGVIWALTHLNEEGAIALERDYLPAVRGLLERNRDDVRKYQSHEVTSYLTGDAGILLLNWKLAPSENLALRIFSAIEANSQDPALGLAWGAPGTMLVALFMFERTGEPRWKDLFLRGSEDLWQKWKYDEELRCYLWTHHLYGYSDKLVSGLHGFAANVFPLLRGRALLRPDRQEDLLARTYETLRATALRDGACLNWPLVAGPSARPGSSALLVQHCWGAPGMINCLSEFPGDQHWPIDKLLSGGGELIWAAGPPIKFPGLCHGAAGSGYALLKLYARTGDDRWLDRARKFAMHGIGQADSWFEKYGQRKYALWTGDLGLAIFLWDCIDGNGKFPTMDVF